LRAKLFKYLNSSKDYPVLAALAAGLYPLGHYYYNNFTFINSWNHFGFFLLVFIVAPIIVFYGIHRISKHITILNRYKKYVIPILNLSSFALLIVISTYGFKKKLMVLVLLIAIGLAILLHKQFKKLIVIQMIMAIMVIASFVPTLYSYFNHNQDWLKQADTIDSVVFKKQPNIYLIQPDGYANFTELKNKTYDFDNAEFEYYLAKNKFKIYNNFRSNYYSTLSSNASLFTMKHHYYSSFKKSSNEVFKAREIIVGDNPVLSIFKNNNYKTHFIAETPYLIANKPEVMYDYSNIDVDEVPFFSKGFDYNRDVIDDLKTAFTKEFKSSNNFYFIQKILPGHVSTYKNQSKGKTKEREIYIERLGWANTWLEDIIAEINEHDPNGLVIILADHGGFVGYDYTRASNIKQENRDLIYSIFSTALAIKWPEDVSKFDVDLKTNVNVFRVLFSYLGNETKYLESLEKDLSFKPITEGAPFGIYELINENGDIVFENFSN